MNDVWTWPGPAAVVLTADLAHVACNVEFLPDLEPVRARRIEATLGRRWATFKLLRIPAQSSSQTGRRPCLRPCCTTADRRPLSDWDRAYSDIAGLFERRADALRSRRILLTENWKLQACASGIPAPACEQWTAHLPARSDAYYPETPYRSTTPVYWLPGQADWPQLTDKVRHALARQLVIGLKRWPDEMFHTTWERDRSGDKDPRRVVTPLRVFLTTVDWVPVQKPGGAAERFMAPRRCWTFPLRGDETPPRFAPLVAKRLRDLLDDDQQGLQRLWQLGLGIWGKVEDAARLVRYLGELIADDAVADVHVPQFRNMYRAAWADCATRSALEPFPRDVRSHHVVEVCGAPRVLPIEPEGNEASPVELIVASADDDLSLHRMLADFHRPILTVGTHAAEVTEILRRRLGSKVTRSTDIALVVLVDGQEIELSVNAETLSLVALLPRLPLLVATILEHRRGSFVHIGQRAFDDALEALQRIRILYAGVVEVRLGGDTRRLPQRMQGVLSIDHPQYPTLVIEAPDHSMTWEKIEGFAQPLLYLLRRQEFGTELRLAVTRMRAANIPADQFTDADVADACDVAVEDVQTTARRIEAAIAPLLSRLHPVVAYYAGMENAAPFEPDTSSINGEAETLAELVKVAGHLAPRTPEQLLTQATRASTLDELRHALEIPLGEMNATLLLVHGRHRLIDYGDRHADEFADHVRRNHARIMDRIRWARWGRFASCDPQSDWLLSSTGFDGGHQATEVEVWRHHGSTLTSFGSGRSGWP